MRKLLDVRKFMVKHSEISKEEFSGAYVAYKKEQQKDMMNFLLSDKQRV